MEESLESLYGRRGINTLNQHHRCWKNSEETGFPEPVWPREPDLQIAFKLAMAALPPNHLVDASISPFSQGGFHRLYLISAPDATTEYMMRVAIPVDPFYKTESEVATMDYVRLHSSVPLPRVIAYQSSAFNDLGFEWILMERIAGCPVADVWDDMPLEAKEALTVDLATHLKSLWKLEFPVFGSIYYAHLWNQVGFASVHPGGGEALDIGPNGNFVIGRMVSSRFFTDKRLLFSPDRGPFATAQRLAQAEAELLARRVRHLSPSPEDQYYSEVDEELAAEADEVLDTVDKLVDVVKKVYTGPDGPEDTKVLWHNDMSAMNVLVDPNTFKLTGIIDWECTAVVPEWETKWETKSRMPRLLHGISVMEPPPLGSLPPEEENEGMAGIRKDWDKVLLRRKYAEITGQSLEPDAETKERIELKCKLASSMSELEDHWTWARGWMQRTFDDGVL